MKYNIKIAFMLIKMIKYKSMNIYKESRVINLNHNMKCRKDLMRKKNSRKISIIICMKYSSLYPAYI